MMCQPKESSTAKGSKSNGVSAAKSFILSVAAMTTVTITSAYVYMVLLMAAIAVTLSFWTTAANSHTPIVTLNKDDERESSENCESK
jgi:hypothetical protein